MLLIEPNRQAADALADWLGLPRELTAAEIAGPGYRATPTSVDLDDWQDATPEDDFEDRDWSEFGDDDAMSEADMRAEWGTYHTSGGSVVG